MRTFIQRLANYARSIKPGFIIVARDAEELIIKRDIQDETIISPATTFMHNLDGVMFDGVFYGDRIFGQPTAAEENQRTLDRIERAKQAGLQVMTLDFTDKPAQIDEVYRKAEARGLIAGAVPAPESNLTRIPPYPRRPFSENPKNILTLNDAENYLLIPNPRAFGRQDQFALKIHDTNFDMIVVEPFHGRDPLSKRAIETLKHKKLGAKRLVLAQVDITTAESYRFYWKPDWREGNPSFIGAPFPGRPDRYFVNFWSPAWQQIIFGNPQSYIYGLISQGYDGIVLEGMRTFLAFEGNVEVPQEFAPMATVPAN